MKHACRATIALCFSSALSFSASVNAQTPDPRIGLRAGKFDAAEATWNLRVVSETRPSPEFIDRVNSDITFTGHYAIQGSFAGYQVWDISNPSRPVLTTAYVCPASQSDVSVYRNLLFVSGEGLGGRIDCGSQGVVDTVSAERLRGIRIFDISDLTKPKYIANVQTCRGSHTHTVVVDPKDRDNVYVYVSGSAPVRSPRELAGCVQALPTSDSNSSLLRIEVIKVPLAHPELAAIVSAPRIFNDLGPVATHGETPEGLAASAAVAAAARARGEFTAIVTGEEMVLRDDFVKPLLDSIVKARSGSGPPTQADSSALRASIQDIVSTLMAGVPEASGTMPAPTQCHDITAYPAIGLGGGACEGYGFLIDIHDTAHPSRIAAVADSNFSYWHSATFNNDGTKILFSDEWGGGVGAKCRSADKREWGADAIFTIVGRKLQFQSYYKLPVAQTPQENCVAHNGSLIPIPGRDVMVQAWYQGGISVFDWTDAAHPKEIAFFDRGPVDSVRLVLAGSWSAYWYNGYIISSEIVRGLDVFELMPSALISQNEIDAAKSVHFDYLNAQGQPRMAWPPSFALARAYVDQLERSKSLSPARVMGVREALRSAETESRARRRAALMTLSTRVERYLRGSTDASKVRALASAVRELAATAR